MRPDRLNPDAPETEPTGFYGRLPVFDRFSRLTDPAIYAPLPEDWVLGLADIVRSTAAIAAGHYKEVNTAAAAVIAAVANALPKDEDFPFVFGGDGANFALPPDRAEIARTALSGVAAWVRDAFGLDLRVALVPVGAVREAGHDVRVARFAASPDVAYAMFDGGGMAYAERRMKEGAFALPPAEPGTRPDLTGLACRFDQIPAERGVILSLIVVPGEAADAAAFAGLVDRILALAEDRAEARRPVPEMGPDMSSPFLGFDLEVKAKGGRRWKGLHKAVLGLERLASFTIYRLRLRVGSFDTTRYRRQLVENTDFRKFDDGLRMTLDCTPTLADRIEALLTRASRQGIARYGLHRQDAALMTCFVPSVTRSDHIHFVDGAMGGYAMAAQALKGV
ncbi:DUF3095 domain-containing protein [Microvirga sp. 17 mud 1-3]|uniref:DUF3095 domain-containing protein n=1 Tax=Microvirga sp. 17 mud 1-3 TaxID=2082949 RepID=UPI000D6C4B68|nr:DUF3095 domain-containing protein [Microvirga sp. 17 mud 1-3]AWM86002.1 adenylate cyclase [Microvirga sp. 17 mud 1-3]